MDKHYLFEFEKHPLKKGTCPQCKKTNCFRFYKDQDRNFGICDRINSCGYYNKPGKTNALIWQPENKNKPSVKIIYPSEEQLKCLESLDSVFHTFCISVLKISREHLRLWNVGTDQKGNTAFVMLTLAGRCINIKYMKYRLEENGKNCKRDKAISFYLKPKANEQYKTCLFGEHLLNGKTVCLVESEKTAIISSFFYPQFNWLATGGCNGLTAEKIQVLNNRDVFYVGDNDKAGKENSTLKKLEHYNLKYQKVFFQSAGAGEDLADLIIKGERPKIKPIREESRDDRQENKTESKNISDFEKVENFISERYTIRNNIVSNKIEYQKRSFPEGEYKELNENNIFRELQRNFINFSINKLKSLLGSEFVSEYNPFTNYFEGLPGYCPESEPDYITNLTKYVPVKDQRRFEAQFKKMLVRCIACSIGNIVNKQALILVHDQQNSGKTTFLRWLNPPALKNYIAENINTDKDSLIAMCTNFIINMDELATLNRAEINALKSIMSKDVFKGRLPYAARETCLVRRANIVGSTNNIEFLSDETGSVRWLCFELTDKLNFEYKNDIDINRVWAQAYFLYKTGFKYELTPQEVAENELANTNHRIISTEQELIQASFEPGIKLEPGSEFKTASQIKLMLTEKYPGEKLNPTMIGKAFKILGYQKVSEKPPNYTCSIKGYFVKIKNNY